MAQFDFFGTWDDDWGLIQLLLSSLPVSIAVDKWYRDKTIVVYKLLDVDLQTMLTERRQMFVIPSFVSLNVAEGLFQHTSGPMQGWYRIEPSRLGEVLVLTLPACYDNSGLTRLGSGILSYAKEYFNHELRAWQPPSESLKEVYRSVRQILKRNLTSYSTGKSTIWVGTEAKQLLDARLAEIADLGV